jgi:hypothetical protein
MLISHDAECCPTHLIGDAPSSEDQFGGTHLRVAQAMVDTVRSERGGQSIGLDGSWGSGKSTIIALFRQELEKDANHRVWIFDAWAHESDPLRRTFLESLIGFLSSRDGHAWIDEGVWQTRIDGLSRRRKTSTQKTSPMLTSQGWIALIALLLIPVGLPFVSEGVKLGVVVPWRSNSGVNATFWIGIALALSPLLVVTSVLVRAAWKRWRKAEGALANAFSDLTDVFSFFVSKGVSQSYTESFESPDPTSIEFESTFRDLMFDALHVDGRKLVLVVDNLDRIDAVDALKIWSTLQTFLQHSRERPKWLDRIWIVMPFDAAAIARLWKSGEQRDDVAATSFLDKTFQLRFEVPPPLLSDWREYFMALLRQALPNHSDEEFHAVYRTIASLRRRDDRDAGVLELKDTGAPTPRDLKILANQIGVLHRLWQDDFPLDHLAYFVVLRRSVPSQTVIGMLRSDTLPGAPSTTGLGTEINDNLAALLFGADRKKARQLLLEDPIVAALVKPDPEALATLSQVSAGFDEVVEDVLERIALDWQGSEGGNVFHAAVALVDSGVLSNAKSFRSSRLVNDLVRLASGVKSLAPFDAETRKGIPIVAGFAKDRAFSGKLYALYASSSSTEIEADPTALLDHVEDAIEMATEFENLGDVDAIKARVKVSGGLDAISSVAKFLVERESFYGGIERRLFESAEPGERLSRAFLALISSGKLRPEHSAVFGMLSSIEPGEISWDEIAEQVKERLQPANAIRSAEALTLLDALTMLAPRDEADATLKDVAHEGIVAHHYAVAVGEKNWAAASFDIYLLFKYQSDLVPQGEVASSSTGYSFLRKHSNSPPDELVERFAELLTERREESLLIRVFQSNPAVRGLVGRTLAALKDEKRGPLLTSPALIVSLWPMLDENAIGVESVYSVSQTELAAACVAEGFQQDRAELYLLVRESIGRSFSDWCTASLSKLDEETWSLALKEADPILRLANACVEDGSPLDAGANIRAALTAIAKEVAAGQELANPDSKTIMASLDLMGNEDREFFADSLFELLRRPPFGKPHAFFDLFGPVISTSREIRTSAFAVAIVEPMLRSNQRSEIQWLSELAKSDATLFSKISSPQRKILLKTIGNIAELPDNLECRDELNVIAEALGKTLPQSRGRSTENQ